VHAAVQKVHQIYKRRNRAFHYLQEKLINKSRASENSVFALQVSELCVFLQAPGAINVV
jgi:hypothetical protein